MLCFKSVNSATDHWPLWILALYKCIILLYMRRLKKKTTTAKCYAARISESLIDLSLSQSSQIHVNKKIRTNFQPERRLLTFHPKTTCVLTPNYFLGYTDTNGVWTYDPTGITSTKYAQFVFDRCYKMEKTLAILGFSLLRRSHFGWYA